MQLAVHTDGMNELLSVEDTLAARPAAPGMRTTSRAAAAATGPTRCALAGRERILTSSTTPTVPFGVHAAAEHLAMVPAVHVLAPGVAHGDADGRAPLACAPGRWRPRGCCTTSA